MKHFLSLLWLVSIAAFAKPSDIYTTYLKEAKQIYQTMSEDERIGQLLLPSYVLLSQAVSPNGDLCQKSLNKSAITKEQLMHDCGLDQIKQYHLGSVLTGGGPWFNEPTLQNWAELNQWATEQHKQGSPNDPLLLTGNDAIHGNMHVQGAVIFPHNIGLGVTHDPNLIQQMGELVGQDSLASGFNWVYMPTIAVAKDLRWGRTYESFAEDPELVKTLGAAYVRGLQNIQNTKIRGTLATAKHFLGDGATQYGFDEGDDAYTGNQSDFWKIHGAPYEGSIDAQVGSMMVSYSAINGNDTRMTFGGKWDIINQLKKQGIIGTDNHHYLFTGFMVSDWNAPTRAAYYYQQQNNASLTLPEIMAKSINSGIDLIMLGQGDLSNPFDIHSTPYFNNVGEVFNAIKSARQQGLISEARLEEAVTRILSVKLAIKTPRKMNYAALQRKERELALTLAQKSLVLLKNDNHQLPLNKNTLSNVIFIGETNDLGLQNGGWTVNWQGQKGSQYFTGIDKMTSGATTLEEGIKNALHNRTVNYIHINQHQTEIPGNINKENTVAIAVISEVPYAEFMGDIGNPVVADEWYNLGAANDYNLYLGLPQNQFLGLQFNDIEANAIQALHNKGIPVITVVYSGRPVILTDGHTKAPFNNSDALIAAFLPGTLGGVAIANALFGDYHFRSENNDQSNTLTFPWPRDMKDVAEHFNSGTLFPVGYGLKN